MQITTATATALLSILVAHVAGSPTKVSGNPDLEKKYTHTHQCTGAQEACTLLRCVHAGQGGSLRLNLTQHGKTYQVQT
jgi:hypothetical protein